MKGIPLLWLYSFNNYQTTNPLIFGSTGTEEKEREEHYLFSFKYYKLGLGIYTTDGDLLNSALLI